MLSIESIALSGVFFWSQLVNNKEDKINEENEKALRLKDTHLEMSKHLVGITILAIFLAFFVENTIWTQTVMGSRTTSGLGIFRRLNPIDAMIMLTIIVCFYILMTNGMSILKPYIPRIATGLLFGIGSTYYITRMANIESIDKYKITFTSVLSFLVGFILCGDIIITFLIDNFDTPENGIRDELTSHKSLLPSLNDQMWIVIIAEVIWLLSLVTYLKRATILSIRDSVENQKNEVSRNKNSNVNQYLRQIPFFLLIVFMSIGVGLIIIQRDVTDLDINIVLVITSFIITSIMLVIFMNTIYGIDWLKDGYKRTIINVVIAFVIMLTTLLTVYHAVSMVGYLIAVTTVMFFLYYIVMGVKILRTDIKTM